MSHRYITVLDRKIPLGVYVAAIKKAKANPDAIFKHGLTTWWGTSGKDIMRQFMEGVMDRIDQGVSYSIRGKN